MINTNKFLHLGFKAVKSSVVIAGVGVAIFATMGFANQFMENALSKHEHSTIENIADTVNDITYKYTGTAATISNEEYRKGLMERHMLDRSQDQMLKNHPGFVDTLAVEKKIIKSNLIKAENLGVFKNENKELFAKEIQLLDSAQKLEGNNARAYDFDNEYNDPSDPSHFNVKNTFQLKNNVEKTLNEMRAKVDSKSNKNKIV